MPAPPTIITPEATLPATTQAFPWEDANHLMQGICFEAAFDAAGTTFILQTEADLTAFYDAVDNSELCRRPIDRADYTFTDGTAIAGLWTIGAGCTAQHDLLSFIRDDTARTITIDLRFITAGTCNYELVRPFWIRLDNAADYEIVITIAE